MGDFVVVFEQDSLNNVVVELLRGAIQHSGDASTSLYWLCYTLVSARTSQRLWIISDGEMGGTDHLITAIYAQELARGARATEKCPQSPTKNGTRAFDNHLW